MMESKQSLINRLVEVLGGLLLSFEGELSSLLKLTTIQATKDLGS